MDEESFRAIRLRTIFECGKWDPQAGDVSALSRYALVLEPDAWQEIAAAAEAMARELLTAERELLHRPELWPRLGLPRGVRKGLHHAARHAKGDDWAGADDLRVVRFDFHLTAQGWKISEANSDVPGGFIEASGFTQLVADHMDGAATPGDPQAALARAFAEGLPSGGHVALVHATAYTDDRQVMLSLSRALQRCRLRASLAAPDAIEWTTSGRARIAGDAIDGIIRFFPGEWLPNLPRRSQWRRFFSAAQIPLSNPATALLTQSKRLPLVWDALRCPMTMWRRFLPETVAATPALARDPRWVIKPALGRVGEAIGMAGVTQAKDWKAIRRALRWRRGAWIAQRKFEAVSLRSEEGPLYPCVGVFVIGARASGMYGRISSRPLIDQHASDIAVLVGCAEPRSHSGTKSQVRRGGAQRGWKEQIGAAAGTV